MTPRLFYGGTFDPVHAGHLAVAVAARDALGAPVALVPAADPPHRETPGADARRRAEMLDLAVEGIPGLSVDRRELRRDGPSWTVATLEEVRADCGDRVPVGWIVGADAFRGLATWHRWRDLFALAHLVVAVRPGHALDGLPSELAEAVAGRWTDDPGPLAATPAGAVWRLRMPPHPASATRVRAGVAAGTGPGPWVAPAVAAYIARHGLYTGGARGRCV